MATVSRSDRVGMTDPYAVAAGRKRISWGAIIAGVVIALAVHMALAILGLGLGLTSVDPNSVNGTPSATTLGTGAAIWWVVSGLIATVAAGYVAARLANVFSRKDGILHGLVAWAAMLLVSVWLVTSLATSALGGVFNILGNVASGAGSAISKVVPEAADAAGVSPDQIQSTVDDLLRNTDTVNSPQAARQQLTSLLQQVLTGQTDVDQAKQQAVDIISKQTGITPEEAQGRLQQYIDKAQQVRQQAEETARQAAAATASALTSASLWGFAALIIGAIAAAVGGAIGTRSENDLADRY